MSIDSPLDGDFFDLLRWVKVRTGEPLKRKTEEAIEYVLARARRHSGDALTNSMERMFYTWHVHDSLREMLGLVPDSPAKTLEDNFALAVAGLLREAHRKQFCEYHRDLFQRLDRDDAVVTFNYDLVPERALKARLDDAATNTPFGRWLYGFGKRPAEAGDLPTLYKLHGSMNWWPIEQGLDPDVRQRNWADFTKSPGYRASSTKGFAFSILLPYWDKKIEENPWKKIWANAATHLRSTQCLIIWGYSLPLTDVKARELFRIAFPPGRNVLKTVCVVDPDAECRRRWREMFFGIRFKGCVNIEEFFRTLRRGGGSAVSFAALCPQQGEGGSGR
jgi:hypothetical protein